MRGGTRKYINKHLAEKFVFKKLAVIAAPKTMGNDAEHIFYCPSEHGERMSLQFGKVNEEI
jgi:hypothetical protein